LQNQQLLRSLKQLMCMIQLVLVLVFVLVISSILLLISEEKARDTLRSSLKSLSAPN